MMTRRYMHESGTTEEEMASVVVSLRKWAALDPNSIFYGKEVPTIEKVLSSSMVSSPLHKRECNVLADGGAAMVVTSAETAKQMGCPAAFKLGESTRFFSAFTTTRSAEKVLEGFVKGTDEVLAQAGLCKGGYRYLEFVHGLSGGSSPVHGSSRFVRTRPGGKDVYGRPHLARRKTALVDHRRRHRPGAYRLRCQHGDLCGNRPTAHGKGRGKAGTEC